jgi:hypothetical protein
VARAILQTPHEADAPVALLLPHDLSSIIGVVGLVKAGRPYVETLARSPAGTQEAKDAERDLGNLLEMYLRRARR